MAGLGSSGPSLARYCESGPCGHEESMKLGFAAWECNVECISGISWSTPPAPKNRSSKPGRSEGHATSVALYPRRRGTFKGEGISICLAAQQPGTGMRTACQG